MLRFVIRAVALAAVFTGCSTASVRTQEGQACSTSSSDDPQLVCTPAQDLVCITTYTRMITDPTEAAKFPGGVRHVYVCRLACNTVDDCHEQGDVCCRGTIYGKTYNKLGGCTPASQCNDESVIDDGGASGDGPASDGPAGDAAAGDSAPPDAAAGQ